MRFKHAGDAPAAHGVALRLHFGPQPPGPVALAVAGKGFAHGHLPRRFDDRLLPAVPPGIVGGRGHAQHLAKLAHGRVGGAVGNVLVVLTGSAGRR